MSATPRANPVVLLHTDKPEAARAALEETHGDLAIHVCDDYAGVPDRLAETGAEAVFTVRFEPAPFPREAMLSAPALKWISVGGSGTDHLNPWDTSRVTVTNSAGVAADMMAEYAIGVTLSFHLDLRGFAKHQAARRWVSGQVEPIAGKTLLLVGLGKTGEAIARRAKAMDMTVLGVRARPAPIAHVDDVAVVDQLERMLSRADVVVVATPLTPATRGLIGASAFAAMKPGAVLIDVSRGGVVSETALLAALDDRRLRGAALDVFATEPLPADHRLWTYDNVIVTPHCSSVYPGWETASVRMFAENLTRYRRGEQLANIVDPARGY